MDRRRQRLDGWYTSLGYIIQQLAGHSRQSRRRLLAHLTVARKMAGRGNRTSTLVLAGSPAARIYVRLALWPSPRPSRDEEWAFIRNQVRLTADPRRDERSTLGWLANKAREM